MVVSLFFFFKQKTAYEIRKGDWSSDVCSSDLDPDGPEADRLQGHQDRELEAEGNVSLRKRGAAVFSDYLYYAFPERELTVTGHVRFEKEGDVITGEKLFYNLDSESGYLEKPAYTFQQFRARGSADRMVMESRTKMRV